MKVDKIDNDEHRYLFLVRMPINFDADARPGVDAFYKLMVPSGLTGAQDQIMTKLNPEFCKEAKNKDIHALKGMELRLRFNQDIFPHICMVRTTCDISADDLDMIVAEKFKDGVLQDWLNEAKI